MWYAPRNNLGSLGIGISVKGSVTHNVKLPAELKTTLKRTLPDLQESFDRISTSTENVVNTLPYVLVAGAAIVSVIVILRAKAKAKKNVV